MVATPYKENWPNNNSDGAAEKGPLKMPLTMSMWGGWRKNYFATDYVDNGSWDGWNKVFEDMEKSPEKRPYTSNVAVQHTTSHWNTLQQTATHCNTHTLQHTTTHIRDLTQVMWVGHIGDTPQHNATHCNALQRTATHCNALQRTATHCNALHHTATHRNTLSHIAGVMNTWDHKMLAQKAHFLTLSPL